MFRITILGTFASLALAVGPTPAARADDDWDDYWDDYRDRVEDLREERRERYEDWLDRQREAREEYFDRLDDQNDRQRRWERRQNRWIFPRYTNPGTVYSGGWQGYSPVFPAPRYYYPGGFDDDRPGGLFLRGPFGRGLTIRW